MSPNQTLIPTNDGSSGLVKSSTQPNVAIEQFSRQVANLNESDYGDFKRKAGLYLSQLESHLASTAVVRSELQRIRMFLLFLPDFNVRTTQHRTLEAAKHLLKLLN